MSSEHFAQTDRLKGTVTMIFITHPVPRVLQVDEVVNLDGNANRVSVVRDEA